MKFCVILEVTHQTVTDGVFQRSKKGREKHADSQLGR